MKKTINKEVRFCDQCGKEDSYPDACLCCGAEMCYDCKEKHGVYYTHAIYCSGSGDGFYCKPCDQKLTADGNDKLHLAYRAIKSLKDELEGWSVAFRKRQEAADKAVKALAR